MFLPQVGPAIAASLLGAGLATRFGAKRLYLAGLAADLVSMALLVVSWGFTSDKRSSYAILLIGHRVLGLGFGLTVPALNTFAAAFHPEDEDRAVLALNALLGLGHGARAGVRRDLRRAGVLVGVAGAAVVFLVGLLVVSVPPPARRPPSPPRAGLAPGSRRASGCSPGSRSSTASARR